MADRISKETRSRIMSRIRYRDTKPELILKKALRGFGFSHHPKIKGSPDFIHRKRKIAVFVHGCFWHKCSKHYIEPTSNKGYWLPKIERNVERDKENKRTLRKEGYKVITIWEHEIKSGDFLRRLIGHFPS